MFSQTFVSPILLFFVVGCCPIQLSSSIYFQMYQESEKRQIWHERNQQQPQQLNRYKYSLAATTRHEYPIYRYLITYLHVRCLPQMVSLPKTRWCFGRWLGDQYGSPVVLAQIEKIFIHVEKYIALHIYGGHPFVCFHRKPCCLDLQGPILCNHGSFLFHTIYFTILLPCSPDMGLVRNLLYLILFPCRKETPNYRESASCHRDHSLWRQFKWYPCHIHQQGIRYLCMDSVWDMSFWGTLRGGHNLIPIWSPHNLTRICLCIRLHEFNRCSHPDLFPCCTTMV